MTPERSIRNLALTGFMGTGKSTIGHGVAHQLNFEFLDTDHLIETRAGKTIPEIFAQDGEPAFRDWEARIVAELACRENLVISTGGGLGANPEHLASLKHHALVVCLWATAEIIWERVRHLSHRPLLQVPDPEARIRQLLTEREPVYRQADVLINTGPRPARDVIQHVLREFLSVQRQQRCR